VHSIIISNVSNNFNPVVGLMGVCNGSYIAELDNLPTGPYPEYEDDHGNGQAESFDTNINGGDYYIRMYHYDGGESPQISFDIRVE